MVAQVGFLLWGEIVLGVTSLPTIPTSCAVVSVFLLRREIVFGYSVSKKDSYSVSLIERQTASKGVCYRLVWAEPKTIATSAILYLIKFVLYHFPVKPPCFYGTNRKPLKRAF